MKYLISLFFSLTMSFCNAQNAVNNTNELKKEVIIVYGSDSCHSCLKTKAFLKDIKVKFTYYDIDVNKEKEQEMLVKLQQNNISIYTLNLPVIDNKGDIFLNKGNLKEFLKVLEKKMKKNENQKT
ncbi:glutaredoxin family protein [Polaribacter sp.]|jgi:glutaredoxin 3|uniref:glutaredoxin family protein n=1 Tax=Polaribacter sp. TaxID=1920175 RepID=UPI003F6A05B2